MKMTKCDVCGKLFDGFELVNIFVPNKIGEGSYCIDICDDCREIYDGINAYYYVTEWYKEIERHKKAMKDITANVRKAELEFMNNVAIGF